MHYKKKCTKCIYYFVMNCFLRVNSLYLELTAYFKISNIHTVGLLREGYYGLKMKMSSAFIQ